MAEYIERQKLYNNLVLLAKYETGERQQGILGCAETVRIFPAADVAPVRHGKWEIVVGSNGNEYMVCTCCRVSQDLTGVFTYCPNCGAKMDGVDDG